MDNGIFVSDCNRDVFYFHKTLAFPCVLGNFLFVGSVAQSDRVSETRTIKDHSAKNATRYAPYNIMDFIEF